MSKRAKIALWTAAVLIVLIIALVQLSGVYVNWTWFGELGFHSVYSTIFWTRIALFFIFGTLITLIIAGNLVIAYMLSPPFRPMSAEQQNIERYRGELADRAARGVSTRPSERVIARLDAETTLLRSWADGDARASAR